MPGKNIRYEGIPTFAPEHFARVRQIDTMKRKQFVKGIEQIAQEYEAANPLGDRETMIADSRYRFVEKTVR